MEFPERLAFIIERLNYSKVDFGIKCGVSKGQIYNYVNGDQFPGTKFYLKLKDEFPRVNIDWLICGAGDPFFDDVEGIGNVMPMDPAIALLMEVEREVGVHLTPKQREAVIPILRREVRRKMDEAKKDFKDLIRSFDD